MLLTVTREQKTMHTAYFTICLVSVGHDGRRMIKYKKRFRSQERAFNYFKGLQEQGNICVDDISYAFGELILS